MRSKLKLKTRLSIDISLIIALVVVIITSIQTLTKITDLQDIVHNKMDYTLSESLDDFNVWNNTQIKMIENLSEQIKFYDLSSNKTKMENYFKDIASKHDGIGMLYYAKNNNVVINSADWVPGPEFVATGRSWYIAASQVDDVIITAPYVDANTGGVVVTFAKAVKTDGETQGVLAVDISMDYLSQLIKSSKTDSGDYMFIVDNNQNILIHPDAEYNADENGEFRNLGQINDAYANLVADLKAGEKVYSTIKAETGEYYLYSFHGVDHTDWQMVLFASRSEYLKEFMQTVGANIFVFIISVAIAVVCVVIFCKKYLQPIEQVADCLDQIDKGNLKISTSHIRRNSDDIERLTTSLTSMSEKIAMYLKQLDEFLDSLSNGDFSSEVTGQYDGDFASLKTSMIKIDKSLNETFAYFKKSIEETNSGALQVANNTEGISKSSIKQAEYIGEISNLLTEMNDMIDNNNSVANNAGDLSQKTISDVEECNIKMAQLIEAMNDIKVKSEQINNVIKTIDDIAFQTNILALNAAVEAARAGASGKGFAVVADEVRNLASKSAEAAKGTADLIYSSSQSVENGCKIVDETSVALKDVVDKTADVNKMLKTILEVSNKQKDGSFQIIDKVSKTSEFVNNTAASTEENAAVSEELSGQSSTLENLVSKYKLK